MLEIITKKGTPCHLHFFSTFDIKYHIICLNYLMVLSLRLLLLSSPGLIKGAWTLLLFCFVLLEAAYVYNSRVEYMLQRNHV